VIESQNRAVAIETVGSIGEAGKEANDEGDGTDDPEE
jgi:hypothetical protein